MKLLTFKNKIVISFFCGFALSSVIEVIQFVFHRGLFEFDDIFHNTIGTVIGIGIYVLLVRILSVFISGKKGNKNDS